MAKGKGKKVSSGGPHKKHGPKRHMFKWAGPMKHEFAKAGILNKYHDYESFVLACQAKGKRNPSYQEFNNFRLLSFEEQKAYFKNLSK